MSSAALSIDADRAGIAPAGTGGGVVPSGAWELFTLARNGKPPLRFKGRYLSRHWRFVGPDDQIALDLIKRKVGGFVLVERREGPGATEAVPHRFDHLDAVMTALEQRCAEGIRIPQTDDHPLQVLTGLNAHLRLTHEFAVLCGDAMADWVAMTQL